jgi:photosystem II stability/assembly factor-like uncharacterized protein
MKKTISHCTFFLLFVLAATSLKAQPWLQSLYLQNPNLKENEERFNFYEIQKAFHLYEKEYSAIKKNNSDYESEDENESDIPGLMQYKRWEYYMESRVYPSGDISLPSGNREYFKNYLNSNYFLKKSGNGNNADALPFAGNWTSIGPFTNPAGNSGVGRIDFVRFNPADNNIIYVGAPSGGLWKSTDGGATWSTNTDSLPVIGCSDLIIDPTNTNTMYLATGDYDNGSNYSIGVLKSTDGGATWDTTGLNWSVTLRRRISKLIMNPLNSNSLIAATKAGIFKTTDAGATWTLTIAANFTDVAYNPQDTAVVYCTVQSMVASTKFFKSIDGGLTFTNIISGLPAPTAVNRFQIGVSPASPSSVYVVASGCSGCPSGFNGLYLSTDTGNNFTLQSSTPDIIGNQGWYDLAIAVNPYNVNDVYVGGQPQYHSTDGGVTWSLINAGIHSDVHAITFLPGDSTTLFSCNDGGIYRSTDNGASFVSLNNGLAISQMYRLGTSATDTGLNLAGYQDEGTNRLSSGNWSRVFGADGMECIIDYSNSNTLYFEMQNGGIFRSYDGGATYTSIVNTYFSGVNAPGPWVTPYIMHPTDTNTLLVGKSQVYRSTDQGASWAQVGSVSAPSGIIALCYAPSNPNYIYAASQTNFYVSVDGNTFTDRTGTLPIGLGYITYVAASNTDQNKVWVTFSGYSDTVKVYASADAGVTWTNYSDGLPNLPVSCIVYQNNTNDALYIGTDIGVYYRDNTMSSWQAFFDGLPNVVIGELEIQYNAGKLRAATYGRGMWESDLYNSTTGINAPVENSGLKIYPDPNNGNFEIKLTGNKGEPIKMEVYNDVAKKIFSSTDRNEGNVFVRNINLDIEASGIYYVRVYTKSNSYGSKVVMMK